MCHDLSHSTLLYDIHFSSPVICLKNEIFFNRELHIEIWLRMFFFHLTSEEPKHESD